MFFYTHSLYFMCHCTEYKLSALQVRLLEESKLNATTQQFVTAAPCVRRWPPIYISVLGKNIQNI